MSGGTTNSPTVNTAGTYILTVTNTTNGCSASDAVIVTSDGGLPTANAGASKTLTCTTTSVVLDGTGSSSGAGITYTWSGTIVSGGTTNLPTVNTAGTYNLTVTNTANGCSASNSVVVNLNNTIPTANAGLDKTITCSSPLVILDGTSSSSGAGITYTWSGTIVSGGATNSPTINSAGTYNLTVTNTTNGCSASDGVVVISDGTFPIASAGTGKTLTCTTTSVILDGSGSSTGAGITYAWSGNIVSGGTTNSPTVNTAGTYILTVTNTTNGCSATNNVVVLLNTTPPTANAGADATICTGNSTNLNATGNYTFQWSPSTGLSASTISNPTANPTITTTYTLQATAPNGCTATDNLVVTVLPVPIANAGQDVSLCEGASTTLSASGGAFYQWAPAAGLNKTNISNPTATPTISTTYIVSVSNGFCTTTDDVVITVNPFPIANAGPDVTICAGTSTALNATGGANFSWTPVGGLSNANISNPVASPIVTTTYIVTVSTNGCPNTDDVVITVLPIPIAIAGKDITICNGQSTTLTGSGGTTYVWNGNIATNPLAVTPNATTTYILTAANGNCTNTDDIVVTVNPLPTVNFSADILSNCAPFNVQFTDNSTGAISWSWSFFDPLSKTSNSNVQNPSHTFNTPGIYNISLEITDKNNCKNTFTMPDMIKAFEVPKADFTWTPGVASIGNPELSFSSGNSSGNIDAWLWTFSDVNSMETTANTADASYKYTTPGEYPVTLVVATSNGCLDSITKMVKMKQDFELFMPSAFSPNGDGYNDYFGPKGIGIDYSNYELNIYNRWGELVFHSNDFNHQWDGRVEGKSGKPVEDVYTWVIYIKDVNKTEYRYKGNVTIIN